MKTNIDTLLKQLKSLKAQNNKEKSISNQNTVLDSLYKMLTMPKSEVKATQNDDDLNELDFDNRDVLSDGFDTYNIHFNNSNNHKGSHWYTSKHNYVNQNTVNNLLVTDIVELQNR